MLDGSRLHVVIPDITRRHRAVNIRKFVLRAHNLDELVALGTLSGQAALWHRFRPSRAVRRWSDHRVGASRAGELVPRQATFARLMVSARLTTLRSVGSVAWRFRQAM